MAGVIGIPLDENSSFLRGAAQGPEAIRNAFRSPSSNTCAENGVDLNTSTAWTDYGNMDLPAMPGALQTIAHHVQRLLTQHQHILVLGGDHSISYPVVKAVAQRHSKLNVLHLDAHADLYDSFEGSKYSHACPFARLMEEKCIHRLVQVGLRTLNPHQREQAHRFGVEVIEMKNFSEATAFSFEGPVYVSLDMDVLDPAFAPGISHPEPGGLTTRQVISIIQRLQGELVGADVVELNPTRDINGVTAMTAAKFFKELLARMIIPQSAF